ncbi:phosphotransferase [Thiomicrorhabdus aquaedulcis]|uniref:phosphotransferase n=1 Tax=Thiomicrorhabdus aquaedulcis TaxID=2211106 RepID=UPI000FD8DC60|nr:phosphotransferase [Thiomicrorhabdus aquaedulcis]
MNALTQWLNTHIAPDKQGEFAHVTQCQAIPQAFEDSTHSLWALYSQSLNKAYVLKLCRAQDLKNSVFWNGMHGLFGLNLPQQLATFKHTYKDMARWGLLKVPVLHACGNEQAPFAGFLLTERMQGNALQAHHVTALMVEQLAQHLAQLHLHTQRNFGALHLANNQDDNDSKDNNALAWPGQLFNTVQNLLSDDAQERAVWLALQANLAQLNESVFVPLMVDLRWDQFLQQNGQLTGLVDLDAMVWAPKTLELVMLEYLLTPAHAKVFMQHYGQVHDVPNLQKVRGLYRFLLYKMQVLGSCNLHDWMAHPHVFEVFDAFDVHE